MDWVAFLVSFHYPSSKRNLLPNGKYECLSFSTSTPGSSSNTTYIFARVSRIIKEDHMVYTFKVNTSGCSATLFRRHQFRSLVPFSCWLVRKTTEARHLTDTWITIWKNLKRSLLQNTCRCTPRTKKCSPSLSGETPPCLQVSFLGPVQHGRVKFLWRILSCQSALMHSQLFCSNQSAYACRNENFHTCKPRVINILAEETKSYSPCCRRQLFLELGYPPPDEVGHSFYWEKLCPDFFQLFHLHCNLQGTGSAKNRASVP